MDELQRKINVIGWLTDYQGNISQGKNRVLVELTNLKRMTKFLISSTSHALMLKKLDDFLIDKVRI